MKIAIIGLPNSGKTTVFNALTRGNAGTASFTSARLEPNIAAVGVPDRRVEALSQLYRPKKTTHAEVQYVDIGGLTGSAERGEGLPAEVLSYIGTADALLLVLRDFEDGRVPHPLDSVDPRRDLEIVELELIFSDLAIIERRLERLEKEIRKLPAPQKELRKKEFELLQRLQESLEGEVPLRGVALTSEEEKWIRGYQFLSAKPLLIVRNIGEERLGDDSDDRDLGDREILRLSGKIEAELAQMDEEDSREFMEDLGIETPARNRVIERSYDLLGLMSFLTVGEDEVRAWTIRKGMSAPAAGGVIHSDIERGFIRVEVIPYDDLLAAGSLGEAKKLGKLRTEGKGYIMRDGDIGHFLFNV